MERRLAAIVLTDIVGYSRLMEADEAGTLHRMKARRRELWTPVIDKHGGRVVGTAGDSLLIEFSSAVSAVECAIEVQRGMAAHAAREPDDEKMLLRVGVNIGEVMVDGDDLFGDGVNVAARLQSLAEPGGICISGKAHDEVAGKITALFADAGHHEVKNITRPVRVWRWRPDETVSPAVQASDTGPQPPSERPAIAVLPFTNMSADPEQEYFSDGLTEDIITALTYWRSFPVIARNSSFSYKNKPIDMTQVARELAARYLLEGSVRKVGGRVRITAQLIDGVTGHRQPTRLLGRLCRACDGIQ